MQLTINYLTAKPDVEAWLLTALTGDRNRQRREGDAKPTDRPTQTARRG